jgi:hypothetical protein
MILKKVHIILEKKWSRNNKREKKEKYEKRHDWVAPLVN